MVLAYIISRPHVALHDITPRDTMEVFKLFEATMANMQPGRVNFKDLRRDQLLDHYDDAVKTLQTLIKAKESEIAYRRSLIEMLELSKPLYDNKLTQAKQDYQFVKKQIPSSVDLKGPPKKSLESTTSQVPEAVTPPLPETPTIQTPGSQSSIKAPSELDLSMHTESQNNENRSSLDRRLSEFLKTFPNLTQAGLAPPTSNDTAKPQPGYYTQQPIPPPPTQISATTPPFMAMMRFPPPMIPQHANLNSANHDNHETSDMDLSDHDEPSKSNELNSGVSNIPIVTSSMGPGVVGGQFNNAPPSVPYAPRLNPLPFDPSIMDAGFRESPSSSHDRHSERSSSGSQRHSGGSNSGDGMKHGSSSSSRSAHKHQSTSSSHSSSRSRRR